MIKVSNTKVSQLPTNLAVFIYILKYKIKILRDYVDKKILSHMKNIKIRFRYFHKKNFENVKFKHEILNLKMTERPC